MQLETRSRKNIQRIIIPMFHAEVEYVVFKEFLIFGKGWGGPHPLKEWCT